MIQNIAIKCTENIVLYKEKTRLALSFFMEICPFF